MTRRQPSPAVAPRVLLIALLLIAVAPTRIAAHGLLTNPPARGTLSGRDTKKSHDYQADDNTNFPDAPCDIVAHFPAGYKGLTPGDAVRSQIAYAQTWGPFYPKSRAFRWRAGVCGDHRRRNAPDPPQDHMRGGRFYYGGHVTRTYTEGSVVSFRSSIVAHHNGFMEFHLCDVRRCNGEISEECFRKGACFQLKRAFDPKCQSGLSGECGPIDRRNPGRWYLPCRHTNLISRRGFTFNYYGGRAMRYQLPRGFTCEHCVLHWYWAAANTCNPPGVFEYFDGPDRPRAWGRCPGQGGARGGIARQQGYCGGKRFPEEYYMCADIRIVPKGASTQPRKNPKVFSHLELVKRNGKGHPVLLRRMYNGSFHRFRFRYGDLIDVRASVNRRPLYKGITWFTSRYRNGRKERLIYVRRDGRRPFYMSGDKHGRPFYWHKAFSQRRVDVYARAAGQEIKVQLEFTMY